MTFPPKLNILAASQRALWQELTATPKHFVLYGGTALAFRLGHGVSEDFDFFIGGPKVHSGDRGLFLPDVLQLNSIHSLQALKCASR